MPIYATISDTPDLSKYTYVYTILVGGSYGVKLGLFSTTNISYSPNDAIAGRLMKQGFIMVLELSDEHKDQFLTD